MNHPTIKSVETDIILSCIAGNFIKTELDKIIYKHELVKLTLSNLIYIYSFSILCLKKCPYFSIIQIYTTIT